MATTGRKLAAAVEEYLVELRRIRATGGGTGELSYYPPLNNLLNAGAARCGPRVYCVGQLPSRERAIPTHIDYRRIVQGHIAGSEPYDQKVEH